MNQNRSPSKSFCCGLTDVYEVRRLLHVCSVLAACMKIRMHTFERMLGVDANLQTRDAVLSTLHSGFKAQVHIMQVRIRTSAQREGPDHSADGLARKRSSWRGCTCAPSADSWLTLCSQASLHTGVRRFAAKPGRAEASAREEKLLTKRNVEYHSTKCTEIPCFTFSTKKFEKNSQPLAVLASTRSEVGADGLVWRCRFNEPKSVFISCVRWRPCA